MNTVTVPSVSTQAVDADVLADEILRGSVHSRTRQARLALVAMIVNTGFAAALFGRGLNDIALTGWMAASTVLLILRYFVARSATTDLDQGRAQLARIDRRFRVLSILTQAFCGAGIWIAYLGDDVVAPYLITLLVCLYATGTMVNLAHDYHSLRVSMPLLMGQPIVYWLLEGGEGVVVAVILTGLTLMLLSSGSNSQASFDESIRIRFEKDELLRQLEQETRTTTAALREAEAANKSKSFFMAAASHDLRQPLYAATILHDALAMHKLEPGVAKLVEQQGKALQVASDLFDNLLDLSRFESGVIKPTLGDVNLADIAREVEAEFLPQSAAKGLWLRVDVNDAIVTSDYDLLVRTMRNLLSNAVRYTTTGGIVIRCSKNGATAVLSVRDTGIGIAPHDRERIFREFVQLDNPQRSRDRGVGLGLAIVRHITLLLGHEVSVESSPGAGTEFSICMQRSERVHATERPARTHAALDRELTGLRIWIIEDDALVRGALQVYFSKLGSAHRVATTRDELIALEASDGWPDFAILDDMLGSGESGLELAAWLGSHIGYRRILLMTGNSDGARWRELTDSGFMVARKPVSIAKLEEWFTAGLKDA